MNLNLDTLKTEVLEYLQAQGFVVFHGYSRLADADSFVAWDTERKPDYHEFLATAHAAGAKIIVYHFREFTSAHVEDGMERMEDADLSNEERRNMERRLREMRGYEGFTCALELSFDHAGRVYIFNLRSEWYEDFLDLIEELDAAAPGDEDDEDLGGGYYSRN